MKKEKKRKKCLKYGLIISVFGLLSYWNKENRVTTTKTSAAPAVYKHCTGQTGN